MLDDKKRAEFQQSMASINEVMPTLWWAIYTGCLIQGFTPAQAFLLVQTQILSSCQHGVNGTSGDQAPDIKPKEEEEGFNGRRDDD